MGDTDGDPAAPHAAPAPIASPELMASALAERQAELDARERDVAERERLVASTAEALEHQIGSAKPYLRRIDELRQEVARWAELAAAARRKAEATAKAVADREADAASADDQVEAAKQRQSEVERQVMKALQERDALLRNLALLDTALDARKRRITDLKAVVAMLTTDRDRLYAEVGEAQAPASSTMADHTARV